VRASCDEHDRRLAGGTGLVVARRVRSFIVGAIVWVSASPAFADGDADEPVIPQRVTASHEPSGFVGGGVSLGASHLMDASLVMEAAVRLPDHDVWIRGAGSYGGSFDFEGGGLFLRGTVGIEGLSCGSASLCWLGSIDAGYQRETWRGDDDSDPMEKHYGFLGGVRGGLDAGGDTVRFRLAVEVNACDRHSNVTAPSWDIGGGLTMTLAYRM
jgi:hypothetical protein